MMAARQFWFKAKKFGWGWYPGSWQGWVVIAVYLWFILWDFQRIDSTSHSVSDMLLAFVSDAIILTAMLIGICYRTGEKPRWRWGGKT